MQELKISDSLTGYASIDMPNLKYYDRTFSSEDIPNKSIYQTAFDENNDNMNSVAMDMRVSSNDFQKGIKMTYNKFFKRIDNSAKASVALGIKKDEIIPVILPNLPEARIMIYSDNKIGAVSYPMSPLLPVNQLEKIIYDNGIKNVVLFSQFYEKYAKALKGVENIILLDGSESIPTLIKGLKSMNDTLSGKKPSIPSDSRIILWDEYEKYGKNLKTSITPFYEEGHTAAIIGTSGTTGTPKGVCLTDRNINAVAYAYLNGKCLPQKKLLDALLPSIGYGISLLHYQTISGKMVYLIPELLTDKFPRVLEILKPDHFPGGPVHYITLLNSKEYASGYDFSGKNLISGGATLPQEVERELNKVDNNYSEEGIINNNIVVRPGYGLSENTALGSFSKKGAYKFGSVGIPLPYETISVFKPDTDEELKYYELGEICITGEAVMKEYLNNPEETNKVIKVHKDGKRWIHTKDLGYIDETGHIFFKDRIKNIFMRTGFNVHPTKISEFIATIPYVKNNIVIGFEHPKEQMVPIVFVELNENALNGKSKDEIREELMMACVDNLEATSVPTDFVFVDSIPINPGGKPDYPRIKKESEINLVTNGKVLKKEIVFNK